MNKQGPQNVSRYNDEISQTLSQLQNPRTTLPEGRLGFMAAYGLTDGAVSFDGTHYMWQVNVC